ncbi:MAG: hypothetical protein RIT45_3921 [Pseudomonadota bacterium]
MSEFDAGMRARGNGPAGCGWLASAAALIALLGPGQAAASAGLDSLDCPTIDQTTCPALARALERPDVTVAELGAWLAHAPADGIKLRRAAAVLGIIGGDTARGHLEQAAKRHAAGAFAVDLQAAAARAGSTSARDGLVQSARSGDTRIRLVALSTLASLRHPEAAALARAALDATDARLAATAARALGKVGTGEDGARLLALVRGADTPASVRRAALWAMARLKDTSGMLEATQLVTHPAASVANAALELLAVAPPVWSSPAIRWALEQPALQQAAALPAAAMKDETVSGVALRAAVVPGVPLARYRALIDAAASAPVAGAAARLLDHAETLDEAGKVATLRTVARMNDRSVVPRLVESLVSARSQVANFTVYALEALTGERLGGDLQAWRAWLRGSKPARPDAPPSP